MKDWKEGDIISEAELCFDVLKQNFYEPARPGKVYGLDKGGTQLQFWAKRCA